MRKRRAAREQALQWLYQIDVGKTDVAQALAQPRLRLQEEGLAFAEQLLRGTVANIKPIDALIARYAKEWSLDRMASVDRTILRLTVFEILYLPDIPYSVSVDEAVELAKKYSTGESSKFVNGVLGTLLRDLEQGNLEQLASSAPEPEGAEGTPGEERGA